MKMIRQRYTSLETFTKRKRAYHGRTYQPSCEDIHKIGKICTRIKYFRGQARALPGSPTSSPEPVPVTG